MTQATAAAALSPAALAAADKAETKWQKDYREKQEGPVYPQMPGLDKWRRKATAAGGVRFLSEDDRASYFAAMSRFVSTMTRDNGPAIWRPRCASGSYANTGEGVLEAVARRMAAETESALRRDRDKRLAETDWPKAYAEAMEAKAAERARLATKQAQEAEEAAPAVIAAQTFETAPLPLSVDFGKPANDDRPRKARKPRKSKIHIDAATIAAAAFRARHLARLASLGNGRRA